ncbi:SDR family NAD(P)-dependent oxidoreductase [Nocardia sp. AB354]|uniref:SDR family NAD(P)-dependent oxidoreductase n=1 Tax=Nocardia sp. AB354 TaxID=3413283 RepID=UPI003C23396C
MTWHSDCRAEEKTILVTGASAGIGYFVAEQLAAAGATVVLGCRDTVKAGLAIRAIRRRVPHARPLSVPLDLADLPALPATVDALGVERLDAVVLNAGILLSAPQRRVNSRGHEAMFATNHLGHFALVAHLMPRGRHREHPRPSRRRPGLAHPVATTAVRPSSGPAPARPARGRCAARQARGRREHRPSHPRCRDHRW